MKNLILAFLKDEDGQTSTEYILLIVVAALLVFKFKNVASEKIDKLTGNVFDKADGWVEELDGAR